MNTKIQSIICCPVCKGDVKQEERHYVCLNCQRHYPLVGKIPIFIEDVDYLAYSPNANIEDTPISEHDYSPRARQLIEQCQQGLVLDLGSGGKDLQLDNVVQLDIFAFPQVDVVACGETLPFKDNSFDAVISQAVFEHLRYPEAVVKEIHRVCKSNAVIKIDTAFLQPLHGYPSHYYNATLSGLKNWFSYFDITWEGVESYQHPWLTLRWFLDAYLDGMSSAQRNFFLQQSMQDLMSAFESIAQEKIVDDRANITELKRCLLALNERKILELACGVSIEAKLRDDNESPVKTDVTADNTEQDYRIRQLEAQVERYKRDLQEKDDLLCIKDALLRNKNAVVDYLLNAGSINVLLVLKRIILKLKIIIKRMIIG